MTTFKDHFSGHPDIYKRFRPTYPPALFAWLRAAAPGGDLAWDAGTGNGQAAVALADHFEQVVASDPSAEQIALATPHPRVTYTVARAEDSGLPTHGTDLALSAQALHWFDFEAYFNEVRRVLRPGGIVAAITYNHATVNPEIDAVLGAYIASILGDWPPERGHVNAGYATIPFPFERLEVPGFMLSRDDTVDGLFGYCGTWSAAQRAARRLRSDPRQPFEAALRTAWGDPETLRTITWPLTVLAARLD